MLVSTLFYKAMGFVSVLVLLAIAKDSLDLARDAPPGFATFGFAAENVDAAAAHRTKCNAELGFWVLSAAVRAAGALPVVGALLRFGEVFILLAAFVMMKLGVNVVKSFVTKPHAD